MADACDKDKKRGHVTVKLGVDGLGEKTYTFSGCSIKEAYIAAFNAAMLDVYSAEFGAEKGARLLAETDAAEREQVAVEHMERATFWYDG
jgi:hypothetical protein